MLVSFLGLTLVSHSMKFNKGVVLLVIVIAGFAIAPATNPVFARSSINSGQACSSRGQIRDFKAQRFICLKVNAKAGSSKGSSLVWVKISSPKSTTKPSYTTTTTTTIKFSTLRSAVYDDIIKRAALARSQPSKAAFEFRIAPTISATRAQEIIQAILWAHIPWENQTTGAGLRVIVVDEKNRGGEDFFRANMPAGGGNCPGNGWGDYVGPTQSGHKGFGCWNGEGDYVALMGFGSDAKLSSLSTFIHQTMTFFAQGGIYRKAYGEIPCFLGDGESTLYGNVLGDQSGLTGGETTHQLGQKLARELATENSLKSDSDWLTYLKLREPRDQTCGQRGFGFYIGQLYLEKLYSDFGFEKIATWKSRLSSQDWRVPFQQVFGVNPSQWYSTSLIPYIRESCGC